MAPERLAVVHDPDGDPVGTITLERLAILQSRYMTATKQMTGPSRGHSAGYFEADVAALLRRYKQGAKITGANRQVKLENHWATPPKFFDTLIRHFHLTKERFASPLNFNPSLEEYWSAHPEDAAFGAHHDAYGSQWTGASQANAEYEHADLFKAMRWAVHSAAADPQRPTLTLLIHPAWDEHSDTGYNRWLAERGDAATVLMRIPRHNFKFCKPTQWADTEPMAGHPRWDVNIILVANRAGMAKYYGQDTPTAREGISADIAEALKADLNLDIQPKDVLTWWKMPQGWRPASDQSLMDAVPSCATMKRPKAHRKARWDTSLHKDHTYPPTLGGEELQSAYPPAPLALDWTQLIYTDCSYKKTRDTDTGDKTQKAGSGLYIPRQDGQLEAKGLMAQGHREIITID